MNKLQQAIRKTLAFFDLSQKPLSIDEIWHFLYRVKTSRVKVLIALENLETKGEIGRKNGLYFLAGHQSILKTNKAKNTLQETCWKKVNRFAKMFAYVPFLQNVSVTGSLAAGNSTEESDINILIVTRKNRKWLAKTLATMLLEAFGQNKNRWYKAGKFSIDFVLEEQDLDLTKLTFKKDTFAAYSLANLTPIVDRGGYKKLIAANDWIYQDFPNWQPKEIDSLSSRYTEVEKFILSDRGRKLIEFGKKIKIKQYLDYLKNKTLKAEEAFLKTSSSFKRKEFHQKWQKTVRRFSK
jgi:predicted nucleotidyltransferase